MMSQAGPIFVTGYFRSGKTIVTWLLDSHANLAFSRRANMWPVYFRAFGPLSNDENREACIQAMGTRKQVMEMGINWDRLRTEFQKGAPTYGRLFRIAHEQMAEHRGAVRWGDQSMNLEWYAERILETYSDARIIHVLRDPSDSYEAYTHKHSRRLGGPGAFAAGWKHMARLAEVNAQRHPREYLMVRYEDLVDRPREVAARLCDFVGETFDDQILALKGASRYESERASSRHGWAISGEHVGRGAELDECTRWAIEAATRQVADSWGYDHQPRRQGTVRVGSLLRRAWFQTEQAGETVRLSMASKIPRESASYSPARRRWHQITDSDRFRHTVKRGWASPVFKSELYGKADIARRRLLARRYDGPPFDAVTTFTVFIGHNKSGASMVGSLLDAHERIVLSDELNAVKYVNAGFDREELYRLIHRASVSESRKGRVTARRLGGYSFYVRGQWQGSAKSPLVVGDSTTGKTTRLLSADPQTLKQVEDAVGRDQLKLIHIIRNPFDPISLMMIRGGRTIENSVDEYFSACARLEEIWRRIDNDRILRIYYEDFVADPYSGLQHACEYLGAPAGDEYLQACASIITPDLSRGRERVPWSEDWVEKVESRMAEHSFLDGYSFSEAGRLG